MAVHGNQRSTDVSRSAQRIVGRYLARPVIGVFIVVPLLGAVLKMGNPSWLLTISGAAALYLAVDLLLSWLRHPVRAGVGQHLNLIAWTAGIGAMSAAAWTASGFPYHGELVALVGVVSALAVGLGSSRAEAVLWTVAAGAAVALGASVSGRLVVESGMVVASIAVGTWFGAVVGVVVERLASGARSQARGQAVVVPDAGSGAAQRGAARPSAADFGGRPSV
jgi:hypothetical protein